MTRAAADFVIVGGGIIGLAIAREVKARHPREKVILLEKEDGLARHASGRNSGVLHAGFYYSADSLKARFSREGNRQLTTFCLDRGLPINRCGKIVVTRSEKEVLALEELFRRADRNGVTVERLDEKQAREMEPTVQTVTAALYSPTTSTVDPRQVVESLAKDAVRAGVEVKLGTRYRGFRNNLVTTSHGEVGCGYLINAAGLYADRVARDLGFSADYEILPFKGLYLKKEGNGFVPRMHVYPVPRLDYPFLGVHWTAGVSGEAKLGPTAIPALWREHYRGCGAFNAKELLAIGWREADLWLHDSFGFRALAWEEVRKYSKRAIVELGLNLAPSAEPGSRWSWEPPGLRAQLLNKRTKRLEMDFVIESSDTSLHVLNAVSPAFTCALPFAGHVVDEVERHIR